MRQRPRCPSAAPGAWNRCMHHLSIRRASPTQKKRAPRRFRHDCCRPRGLMTRYDSRQVSDPRTPGATDSRPPAALAGAGERSRCHFREQMRRFHVLSRVDISIFRRVTHDTCIFPPSRALCTTSSTSNFFNCHTSLYLCLLLTPLVESHSALIRSVICDACDGYL